MRSRGFTLLVHQDGALKSREVRIPFWVARATVWGCIVAALLLGALVAFRGPVLVAAVRAPFLEREIERLTRENERVTELARALDEAESRYAQVRSMLGAGSGAPGSPGAVAVAAVNTERLYVAPPMMALAPSNVPAAEPPGLTIPRRWPLSVPAYRTRGLASGDSAEGHGGVDLAVPVGSDVRSSGGGIIKQTGNDAAFGLYILVTHPDGYETMYGHLSRVLVARGDEVRAGQVIGLSGNSGRSTAPHLHFEVRRNGRSMDPFTLVREGT